MCHPDVPPGLEAPDTSRREVVIDLGHGEQMPALHVTAGESPHRVLLIGDVFGRSPFYEHLAALVADAGYQVLLPDLFFRQGPLAEQTKEAAFARRAQLDEARSLDDLRAALTWLRTSSDVATIGVVGFCMGATFVLDLASTQDRLVSVAYYGFPEVAAPSPPPRPADLVSELRGPVLAFWGDEDQAVGMESVGRYIASASASNPSFAANVIPGLGHGFLGSADLNDSTDTGTATWRQSIAFLNEHLKREDSP